MSTFSLTFLGTCACDFSPKLENEYKDCFDFDARRASCVLMNESILIDCGLHALDSLRIAQKPTRVITDILITHFHRDHFNKDNIEEIAKSSAKDRGEPLRLYVREDAVFDDMENVEIIRMKKFERYDINNEFSVIGMPANHSPKSYPQHFIFERDGKKFFYGCDGGWFLNETYQFMKKAKLSLAVLDCTTGDYLGDFRIAEHNSIPMIRLLLPSLKTIGAIDESTKIYLSHLAPSLHKPHKETVKIAHQFGAEVAYDGLIIQV